MINNSKTLVKNSKFNSKVLIATKVLDNGVNIKDEQVKKLVVMAYDKTTFIQEVGRVRFNIEDAPEINLYIPTFEYNNFSGLLKNIENKEKMIKEFEENKDAFGEKYHRDLRRLPRDIFMLTKDNGIDINMNGYARLYKDKSFIEGMINKFKLDKNFAYVWEQLYWLGLEDTFDESNLIYGFNEEVVSDMQQFLVDSYENEILYNKSFFLDAINSIIEADDNLRIELNKLDGGNARSKGQEIFNKLFKELFNKGMISHNFIVSSKLKLETIDGKRKKKTYWIITKIES